MTFIEGIYYVLYSKDYLLMLAFLNIMTGKERVNNNLATLF